MFVIEVLQEVKISLPSLCLANPRTAPGPKHLQVFSLQVYNCSGREKKMWYWPGDSSATGLSKITAVSWNVDQSKPDSHFDSQIDSYFLCILIEYIYSRRQHKCLGENTVPGPWGTLTKYKCLAPTQNWLPNALVEDGEEGLNNFRVRNLGKQIRHLIIFCFNFW